jgi:predicted nucleotidyltransferase component of viral defense system
MLDFQQVLEQYPVHLQGFKRAILREYLQVKILQAIFESKQASQLVFIGGTALRILHDNQRFSEDIDLDQMDLSWDAFGEMILKVERFLTLEGFMVEVQEVAKGTFHCYLRFPELLYGQGLSPHLAHKLLIRVDSAAQGYAYQPEVRILNKFDVFTEVRVAPVNLLLSHKLYSAVNRKRPKGRDFYDITILLGRTKPDYQYLKQKLGVDSPDELRTEILDRTAVYDFEALASDVAPFLMDENQVKRVKLFRTFWQQVDLGI